MAALPSCIVFGALTAWPSDEELAHTHELLLKHSHLRAMVDALQSLPELWGTLVARDSSVTRVPGYDAAEKLYRWASTGESIVPYPGRQANQLAMPMTIIRQFCQYFDYIQTQGDEKQSHGLILEHAAQAGGVQGLCVGLLSALAVGSSTDTRIVALNWAVALRLSFAIGTYVDVDGLSSGETHSLGIRWKSTETLQTIQELVGRYEPSSMTARMPPSPPPLSSLDALTQGLSQRGLTVINTGLTGRYHSSVHIEAIDKVLEACQVYGSLDFGEQSTLPVRSNKDSEAIGVHDAAAIAVRSILVERSNWHSAVMLSLASSTRDLNEPGFILSIGSNAVPRSISQDIKVVEHDGRVDVFATSKPDKETLGLCTGLLSAFVAASAKNGAEFRKSGAAAVRLGMLVGLAIDSQDVASGKGRSKSLTAVWSSPAAREEMVRTLKDSEAYISVHYDENRATITTSSTCISDLTQRLKAAGLSATELNLYGGFHSEANAGILDEVLAFCDSNEAFQLPDAAAATFPIRANDSKGSRLTQGTLHSHALRSILVDSPMWIDTFSAALRDIGDNPSIFSFGPERSVPPSLASRGNLRILQPASGILSTHKPERQPERLWQESDIAVVGMSCKVAGADNLDEFWDLLAAGKSQHRDISSKSSRFSFEDTPFRTTEDANMKRKWFANLIDGHDHFDHRFFKKSARESATMDPQQRHILQAAYQAVEQSGHLRTAEAGRNEKVGCYVGVCLSDYDNNVACHPANAFTATGNLQGFIAGKVSHFFGWTGPALTVDSACSSSLVAVHQACNSILSGECDAALAGGSHVMTSASWFQNLAAGSFLSPTGQCKPFDAKADGYCRGEGVGAVFLKKMSKAVADGDQILGVIAATAVNQSHNCTPIFVPNKSSLTDLFKTVITKAQVEPSQISVIEAHGTGTPVGDPVEYGSIRQVLGGENRSSEKPLVVGSVKGLVGHMECTSGIISLIKVLLMLNKGMLTPQASYDTINPALETRPTDHMSISTRLQPWDTEFRAALINNYGASGSNASMIVTQAPSITGSKDQKVLGMPTKFKYPFCFSGFDDKSIRRYVKAFRNFLTRSGSNTSLANISFNQVHQSNHSLGQNLIVAARTIKELDQDLALFERGDGNISSAPRPSERPTVVLCFGGQVSTSVGLDRQVYDNVAALRKHLRDVDIVVQSLGYTSIFPGIFQRSPVTDTVQLQTMLFAMQYAGARSWIDSGIRPAALVGHSFGELTALCISEALSLEDTVKLIVNRATLVRDSWGSDNGAMMAVEGDPSDVESLIIDANSRHSDVPASIACYNGPRSFTVAGSTNAINAVAARLEELPNKTMKSKRLNVTNAFHSALVDPLLYRLEKSAQGLTFREPVIPLEQATESSTTTKLTARFVADHMRNPVYFYCAIERLARKYSASPCVFLEAGSSSTVTSMAARALVSSNFKNKCLFQGVNVSNCEDGLDKLTDATISLWKAGLDVQHWTHHELQRRSQADIKPLLLPPYQFDTDTPHWVELKALPKHFLEAPLTGEHKKVDETEKPPEGLLTFFGFKDTAQKLARFRVNTMTEKYKRLLSGHLTAKTAPICPATVQMGFVIDAISSIRPAYRATREPQIQEVVYQSPICANSARSTWIEVEVDDEGGALWKFEVLSIQTQTQARMLHTTGQVVFSDVNDSSLKRELVQFERLFGHHRAVELLQSPNVDEVLANRTIYRIFAEIVDYGPEFRGLQKLVGRGHESAGYVVRQNSTLHEESKDGSSFDAHLADTFCQLGGIWINSMADQSASDDIYIANGIDKWIRAPPKANPPNEFQVFATHHRPSNRLSLTDVFVFDAADGALVEVILGIAYVKIPMLSMTKLLVRLTEPAWLAKTASGTEMAAPPAITSPTASNIENIPLPVAHPTEAAVLPTQIQPTVQHKPPKSNQKTAQDEVMLRVKAIIAELAGLEIDGIHDDSELADLGIDSLTGMELVQDIEKAFKVTLPESEVLAVCDLPGLLTCVFGALGTGMDDELEEQGEEDTDSDKYNTTSSSSDNGEISQQTTPSSASHTDKEEHVMSGDSSLSFATVMEAFNETKKLTDKRVADFKQTNYVAESLPMQNELTVALVLEAFESLGAGFGEAQRGQQLSRISHGKEHHPFVTYLYDMIEAKTQIIKLDGDQVTRTAVPLPRRSSQEIYEDMAVRFPDQHGANKLIYYAGVNLGRVLSGETDGVKLIFGNAEGRSLVSAFYAEWPLNRVLYAQMEDFLTRLTSKLQANREISESAPLRILEMGAGTGGTTRRIVPLLAQLRVPVEYTFTDLAPSFVAAARKTWGQQFPWMKFRNHDIEKAPEQDLMGTQHFVIASNAVHATRSLVGSTRNVRKMLRPDGFLLMLEMTRTPYWVDLIFGLFEGWWLFDDGRRHALTHESRWETDLQAGGYGHVDWTDGNRPESDIEKLILAAANPTSHCDRAPTTGTLAYQTKKGASASCESREKVVASYVHDLNDGFVEAIEQSVSSSASRSSMPPQSSGTCILITGGTGGLGSHLVSKAARRKDVTRVICLNRRNKQNPDPQDRQEQALRKQGIELSPEDWAKIHALETDLSQPGLGLPTEAYHTLLATVTHIVHNAWLMHSKWPVKRFEPQLRIMAHMLGLARDISIYGKHSRPVTFEFVSSIATVGHHPLWTHGSVVTEERVPIESVLPTGYGDAKYICERMLDTTLHFYPDRFRATAVRLGQIAGSRINGHWNPIEHVPFLVKSSQTLGSLPALQGTAGWTPTDDVAGTLIDILTQPDDVALHPIYHIENPIRQSWPDITAIWADALAIPRDGTGIIPLEEWAQRVRNWPRSEDNGPEGANPAYLLVDFLLDNFDRMSCGGLLMGTAKAREHSPTLASLGPVSESLVKTFISRWKDIGFLKESGSRQVGMPVSTVSENDLEGYLGV